MSTSATPQQQDWSLMSERHDVARGVLIATVFGSFIWAFALGAFALGVWLL